MKVNRALTINRFCGKKMKTFMNLIGTTQRLLCENSGKFNLTTRQKTLFLNGMIFIIKRNLEKKKNSANDGKGSIFFMRVRKKKTLSKS